MAIAKLFVLQVNVKNKRKGNCEAFCVRKRKKIQYEYTKKDFGGNAFTRYTYFLY